MRVVHHNIRGLNQAKYDFYDAMINADKADIIFLSETWHNHSIQKTTNFLRHSSSTANRIRWGSAGRTRLPGGILVLVRPSLHPFVQFDTTQQTDTIAMTISGLKMVCLYLPPSMTNDERFSALWNYTHYDVIVGDINIRMHGRSPSTIETRDALNHFVEESGLILHPPNSQLDHLLSRAETARDHLYTRTDLRTDHMQQLFTIVLPGRTAQESVNQYPFASAFFRLSPLLDPRSKGPFTHMLCAAYERCADLISLTIEEQQGLMFIGDIEPQEAVDVIDELLVNVLHDVQKRYLERIEDRSSSQSQPAKTAPQNVSSATRLFKSLKKAKATSIKSDNPEQTPSQCARARYQSLWHDQEEPLDLSSPVCSAVSINLQTHTKIHRLIRNYNSTKAAGGDGIHPIIMKTLLQSSFPNHLGDLYEMISESGITPTRWNTAITTLISKKDDGSPCTPSEVRPISLTVMFRRIFERIILEELESIVHLHPCQFGFKKGFDTQTNILTVEAARENGTRNRIVTDYKEAYDSPRWKQIQQKLTQYGVTPILVKIITNLMFKQMFSVLIVNGAQVQAVRMNKGLFQGSLLSPILFNIFIDDLLWGLHQRFSTQINRYPALMYADDLLLLWGGVEEAIMMWIYLQEWNQLNRMTLNIRKCSYVTLGERYSMLESQGLNLNLTHKHLGVTMTARGFDWDAQITRTTKKAKGILGLLYRFCHTWKTTIKIQLVKTFVLPITQYAIPIMVINASKTLANNSVECIFEHSQKLSKGFLSTQWKILDSITNLAHRFILGLKIYPKLSAALTSIESICTRGVELALQMKTIQLPFIALDNPLTTATSTMRTWLYHNHEITRSFPIQSQSTTKQQHKEGIRTHLRNLKELRLRSFYPQNHPVTGSNRISRTNIDKILTSNRHALEKHMIFWRANQFGRGNDRYCVCSEPFTQSHTSSCAHTAGIDTFNFDEMIENERWNELEKVISRWWTVITADNNEV
jgi:hypothetical protein